ncbi:MAG: CDP-alcohol phosphatidyltransferase family protein [Thermoprotei archaeon]
MLTRIRNAVTPILKRLGILLWKLKISPNLLTLSGLVMSLATPVFAFFGVVSAVLALMVLSLACDMLDGAVARVAGHATPRGALLDSVSDRVGELMFVLSLGIMKVEWVVLTLFLGTSFLISYLRAIASQHGINLEGVGFMERGERGLLLVLSTFLLLLSMRHYTELLIVFGVVLNTVTVVQRFTKLIISLNTTESSAPS